jgi:protein-S-isoprenylcysteine O-methyltransferase Ste14
MERWRRYLPQVLTVIWTLVIIGQMVLAFFFYVPGVRVLKHIGWIVVMPISGVFGWVPILTFRRAGAVAKGDSYMETTRLVDTGLYAIVRHPQFLAGVLINVAVALISQHWLIILLGAISIGFVYGDTWRAERTLVEKFGDEYRRYRERVPRLNAAWGIVLWLRRRGKTA